MRGRDPGLALLLAVVAVILQTTLFTQLKVFGASPNLVLLVVVATVRHLHPEPGVLIGFTAGMLMDLLGDSPLGMWAFVMTAVAYVTLRFRDRGEQAPALIGVGVFALAFFGEALFVLLGTLFGQKLLSNSGVVRTIILTSLYSAALAAAVVPGVTAIMKQRRRSWAL